MPTILIAEDELLVSHAARLELEEAGFTVLDAADGDEAVEEFKRLHPDVVTMDIVMPRRSGIDAVKGISAPVEVSRVRD